MFQLYDFFVQFRKAGHPRARMDRTTAIPIWDGCAMASSRAHGPDEKNRSPGDTGSVSRRSSSHHCFNISLREISLARQEQLGDSFNRRPVHLDLCHGTIVEELKRLLCSLCKYPIAILSESHVASGSLNVPLVLFLIHKFVQGRSPQ